MILSQNNKFLTYNLCRLKTDNPFNIDIKQTEMQSEQFLFLLSLKFVQAKDNDRQRAMMC